MIDSSMDVIRESVSRGRAGLPGRVRHVRAQAPEQADRAEPAQADDADRGAGARPAVVHRRARSSARWSRPNGGASPPSADVSERRRSPRDGRRPRYSVTICRFLATLRPASSTRSNRTRCPIRSVRRPEPSTETASIADLGAVVHQQVAGALLDLEVLDRPLWHRTLPSYARRRAPRSICRQTSRVRPRRPSASSVRISSGRSTSNDSSRRSTTDTGRPRVSRELHVAPERVRSEPRGDRPRRAAQEQAGPRPVRRTRQDHRAERPERLVQGVDGHERDVRRQDRERVRALLLRLGLRPAGSRWRAAAWPRGSGGRRGPRRSRAPPRRARPPRSPNPAPRARRPARPRASRA